MWFQYEKQYTGIWQGVLYTDKPLMKSSNGQIVESKQLVEVPNWYTLDECIAAYPLSD